MQRSFFQRSTTVFSSIRGLATASHPNPGNFANRPRAELSRIGRKGGRKGGKAKGVGGFHDMDPEKQHEIASRGGRAARKVEKARGEHDRYHPHGPTSLPPEFDRGWVV
ncbi:hypothetical protein ASPWEDRAFT_30158 [Aspergillus wentii DTO 134E9]|uniref:Conidiation-specific protein 10 n=1 Tax=Aspergillus wentii DTO 134E9 TaxID=1073089 RepID=A0A1L9RDQ0_ASPWE|nr:uncharacterized protein ASPWEDRAFT_30158 [Aspergillus wentii DTO 134E9]KAI9933314.1 hypothetical protein MW887_007787 [Aspergillus wentii]OJJ33045.1 hypothetical protein ASPWEDRAFT_30158 [Aspergillus wentii DTO 134E9]